MNLSIVVETIERLNPHRYWRLEKKGESASITIAVGEKQVYRTLMLPATYQLEHVQSLEDLVLDMIAELNRKITCGTL